MSTVERVKKIERCEVCAYTSKPCASCRNARRRAIYEATTPRVRVLTPRCDACRSLPRACWPCQKARMAADPEYAARRDAQVKRAEAARKAKNAANRPAVVRIGRPPKPKPEPAPKPATPRRPVEQRPTLAPRTKARATRDELVAKPQPKDRNWDLTTCIGCLRRGRFEGPYHSEECRVRYAPPSGFDGNPKAKSYTSEARA